MREIPATWMRGGTSKCWVFRRSDLPSSEAAVDAALLRVYGSPDTRQVDGVGGGTSTTSKAVILAPSARPDVDVDYTFAQVGIDEAKVDRGSNCGNCSAVVASFAINEGWVTPADGETVVRVLNTNTDQVILQWIPTPGGVLPEEPTQDVPGVPFPGASVRMGFLDPAGRTTGRLLPTGNRVDVVEVDGTPFSVSLVDAGAPVVVVGADELGAPAHATPSELDATPGLLGLLDAIRRRAAVAMGLAATPERAERAVPKLAVVGPADRERADLTVRMLSMGRFHPAVPMTGSVALTLAAREPGTLVHDVAEPADPGRLRIDTPAGTVTTFLDSHDGLPVVGVTRSYRRLVRGHVLLPPESVAPVGPPVAAAMAR